jgi:hypothetical protein
MRDHAERLFAVEQQARAKVNAAGQAVQLGNDDGRIGQARDLQRGGQLRALVEGVGPLAGLDLDERRDDLEPVGGGVGIDGGGLGLDAET